MSGPKRLAGRCHQASSPQSTYESVTQSERSAITKGSPSSPLTPGLASARTKEKAAAAEPASAKTHTVTAFGTRTPPKLASCASAAVAIPGSLLTVGSRQAWTEPFNAAARNWGKRTGMKGGVCSEDTPRARRLHLRKG